MTMLGVLSFFENTTANLIFIDLVCTMPCDIPYCIPPYCPDNCEFIVITDKWVSGRVHTISSLGKIMADPAWCWSSLITIPHASGGR